MIYTFFSSQNCIYTFDVYMRICIYIYTLHWVSVAHALRAEVRHYDPLFTNETPGAVGDVLADLNPNSIEVLNDCRLEPVLGEAELGAALQFERQGYFCVDTDSRPDRPVFNRTIGLRDSWAREKTKDKS